MASDCRENQPRDFNLEFSEAHVSFFIMLLSFIRKDGIEDKSTRRRFNSFDDGST